VMIASLGVGVGIDYSIHFMARLQLEYRRLKDAGLAVKEAFNNAGAAIVINALTVACGMLVFVAGKLLPLRTFGLLLALAMAVSALSALLLLPLVIKLFPRRFFG
jgi:predicted RND superfamily exporter protein